jgi:hypothetical protein
VALYHLNEVSGGVLLAGAEDGAVRVWRNFPNRSAQRLATAWRVSCWWTAAACQVAKMHIAKPCDQTVQGERTRQHAVQWCLLQAVPMTIAGTALASPVVYEWQSSRDLLVAAGGTMPGAAYVWNLEREMCQDKVLLHASSTCGQVLGRQQLRVW